MVIYLAALGGVGVHFSRRQRDLGDFFLARQSMTYVAYHTSIGLMWPSTFGLVATLLSGAVLSVVLSERPSADALRLTWRGVMARPEPFEADGARAFQASDQVSP